MKYSILTATDKLFQYGFFNDDNVFVGTTLKGRDFVYDSLNPVAPIAGTVQLMTETLFDKAFPTELTTVSVANLPTADILHSLDVDYYSFDAFIGYKQSTPTARLMLTDGNDYFNTSTWGVNGMDIRSLGGNDTVIGGTTDDIIRTSDGDDVVIGNAGNDILNGGQGNDTVIGGEGDDEVIGAGGNDYLEGGTGNDKMSGGAGDDVVNGGSGDNRLDGAKGDDQIIGGNGDDIVAAGRGNDRIDAGGGNNRIDGGLGSDVFIFRDQSEDEGTSRVRDFFLSRDKLQIRLDDDMTEQESFDAFLLQATQVHSNVIWTSEEHDIEIRLDNVDLTELTVDNFESSIGLL